MTGGGSSSFGLSAATIREPFEVSTALRQIIALAFPLSLSQMTLSSVAIVSVFYAGAFVGGGGDGSSDTTAAGDGADDGEDIGVVALGAAALAFSFINATIYSVAAGFGGGALETFFAQSFGKDPNSKQYGVYAQRMVLMLGLIFALPLALMFWFSEPLLLLMGQTSGVAYHVGLFTRIALIGMVPFMLVEVAKRYYQAQHVAAPITVFTTVGALVVNPLVLVVCHSVFGLRFTSIPIAWACLQIFLIACFVGYARVGGEVEAAADDGEGEAAVSNTTTTNSTNSAGKESGDRDLSIIVSASSPTTVHNANDASASSFSSPVPLTTISSRRSLADRTWGGWDLSAAMQDWAPMLRLGGLGFLMMISEFIVVEINIMSAGFVDETSLAAFSIAVQLSFFSWNIAAGLYGTMSVLVGTFVGAGEGKKAQQYAQLGTVCALSVSLFNGVWMYAFGEVLANAFTDSEAVREAFRPMLPLAILFHIGDGVMSNALGIFRGAGMQLRGAIAITVSYAIVGMPLGWVLCFYFGYGAPMLWLGPAMGTICVGWPICALGMLKSSHWIAAGEEGHANANANASAEGEGIGSGSPRSPIIIVAVASPALRESPRHCCSALGGGAEEMLPVP